MAKIATVDIEACDDCVIAIANDDYTGVDDNRAAEIKAGIDQFEGYLVVGEEVGFRNRNCDVCNALPGDRHQVTMLVD